MLLLLLLLSKSRRHCACLRTNTCNTLGPSAVQHNAPHAHKCMHVQHGQKCIAAAQPNVNSTCEALYHCIRGTCGALGDLFSENCKCTKALQDFSCLHRTITSTAQAACLLAQLAYCAQLSKISAGHSADIFHFDFFIMPVQCHYECCAVLCPDQPCLAQYVKHNLSGFSL